MVEVLKYRDTHGNIPYDRWFRTLRDVRAKSRIQIRVDRLSLGLEGDARSVGEGVRELRIPEGKGYRVYYAWDDQKAVLLLCGGDKSTQSKDIRMAKRYWRDYRHE